MTKHSPPHDKGSVFLLLQNKKGRKVGGIHYLCYVCAVDRRKTARTISDRVLYNPNSTFWWWKGTSVWLRVIIDQFLLIETSILQKLWCSVCDCGRKGAPKHVLVLLKCGSTIGCDCHRRVQYLVIRASMFLFRFDSILLMIFCWKDRFPMKDKLNTPFIFWEGLTLKILPWIKIWSLMLSVRGLRTPDVGGCQKISHIQQLKMSQSHSREKKKVIRSENYLRIRSFVC